MTASIRSRVLDTVNGQPGWLTGAAIAQRIGMAYKPTIDALNALLNLGQIARAGKKTTARWGQADLAINHTALDAGQLLHQCFGRFFK